MSAVSAGGETNDRGEIKRVSWRKNRKMKYDFIPDSVSEHDNVYDVLKERGFIEQSTDEEKVRELLIQQG